VVQAVIDSIHGIDVNPFACYLAETNLLIQVLDLLMSARRAGVQKRIDRFHVYCADALVTDSHARKDLGSHIAAIPAEERPAEMMKARLGMYEDGFDFLVGNPPYVRADDTSPTIGQFRDAVVASGEYECLEKRWDLYVPFVELNARLLKKTGRCCLITIESIGDAPYAARLREKLCTAWTLERLVFAERLKLFPDAKWQSNRIFTFRGTPPQENEVVTRLRATRLSATRLEVEALDTVPLATGSSKVFSIRPAVDLDLSKTVRLGAICYISYGMRLNSTDKFKDGEEVAVPADFMFQAIGWRKGAAPRSALFESFRREDTVSDTCDGLHSRVYVDSGDDLIDAGLYAHQWVEYGTATRVPAFVYRA
jgi:type I restriction enzyme M protein